MADPALIEATRAICGTRDPEDTGPCDYPTCRGKSFQCDNDAACARAALAAHDAWLRSAGMAVVPVDLELARRRLGELNECAPISDCSDCERGLTTSCRRRAEAVLGEK